MKFAISTSHRKVPGTDPRPPEVMVQPTECHSNVTRDCRDTWFYRLWYDPALTSDRQRSWCSQQNAISM